MQPHSHRSGTIFLFLIYLGVFLNRNDAEVLYKYGSIAGEWKIKFEKSDSLQFITNNVNDVSFTIYDVNLKASDVEFYFELQNSHPSVVCASSQVYRSNFTTKYNETNNLAVWKGVLPVLPQNYGRSRLSLVLRTPDGDIEYNKDAGIDVTVQRSKISHETVFELSAGAIILFMFLNLGTVLDLQRLKRIILLPIGPGVAFASRYVVMPAIGLGLGFLFFPQDKNLQLAVFFSTLSPSGGIANICNFFLEGNIDLSIAATTLNSLMTLAMFPLWILVLGKVVYGSSGLSVPFVSLIISFVGILLALIAGISLRLCLPKATVQIIRFLKPLAVVLSLLLVVVTVGVHIMSFRYFTPMFIAVAFVLPLLSYVITFGLSKLLCMVNNDAMTISLEIGVMNMTVPTLLLNVSLQSTEANKVLALPICCALISLVYVVILYFAKRINCKLNEFSIFNSTEKYDIAE